MARPSQQIDQALLASGRVLFPTAGSAGLSVRALAAHAGVNQAMFHYHFGSKDDFLRTLLQQMYEEMFGALSAAVLHAGPAIERLRHALTTIARFARSHRRVLARLWMDAVSGEAVALDFLRRNVPRHVQVLLVLLREAEAEQALRPMPALQRLAFLMGSVMLPLIFIGGIVEAGPGLPELVALFEAEVSSDAAIAERIDLALAALAAPAEATPARPRSRRPAPKKKAVKR
ncbi:MAG: TetR/AcrR family transcriptional regulator [Caldimonas sp.]